MSINLWTFGSFKNGKVTLLGALQPRNLEKVNGLCPRSLCHAPLPAQLVAQPAGGVGYSILKGDAKIHEYTEVLFSKFSLS